MVLTTNNTLVLNGVMSKPILTEVINRAKGQTALSLKIKSVRPDSRIRQGHINNWMTRSGGQVPPEWVLAVCEADSWIAKPHDLRPDIYPNPNDGLPAHLRVAA